MKQIVSIVIISIVLLVIVNIFAFSFITKPRNEQSAQATASPVIAQSPSSTTHPNPSILETSGDRTQIYLVALEDNGKRGRKIGCNDSLVPVEMDISSNENRVKQTISELLATPNSESTEYYNSLANSKLTIDKIEETSEVYAVYLKGQIQLGGACDTPRFDSQLTSTISQFATEKEIRIYINNTLLKEILSENS